MIESDFLKLTRNPDWSITEKEEKKSFYWLDEYFNNVKCRIRIVIVTYFVTVCLKFEVKNFDREVLWRCIPSISRS